VHQDIIGLEVSVHDVIFWKDLKSLHHLTEIDKSSFFREGPFFLHEFVKSSPITEFIDEVKVVDGLQYINVPDDVGTVLDGGENVDFVDGALLKFGDLLELLCIDDLDCHLLFCFHMNCLVNFTVDSFAELFENGVVFNDFAHGRKGNEVKFKMDIKKNWNKINNLSTRKAQISLNLKVSQNC
jgi:hypothetical protein